MVARQAHNLEVGVFKSTLRNQTDYNSIDTMSVLFLFICDIITTGNDVSLLEIENRKNKADDVYDFLS